MTRTRFTLFSRILHWLMAAMLLSMLFIGVGMVTSLTHYHQLVSIHRPLGILILLLVIVRYMNRKLSELPDFLPTMSECEKKMSHATEMLLYLLMFVQPLVGWLMLSAGHFPIVMVGSIHLPAIFPASPVVYAILRRTHTVLAYSLFATFLAHLGGVLYHTIVLRDRLLHRMSLAPSQDNEK